MKKIIIFFILIINIFLYQSLFSQGLFDFFKSLDDLSNSCKSKKIRKGKYLVTTAKYCKISGAKIEKIVTYQDLKWNDFIRKEYFNATYAKGSKYKRSIDTYEDGELVKEEWFDYTTAKGNKFKKSISTYENGKLVKVEYFDYTYADGDKYKKRIITYEDGEKVKEEWFDYTYADGDKFRWSTEYNDVNQQREVKEIYGYYIKKENKTFDVVNWRGDWSTCFFDYYHKGKIIKTQDNPSRNCKK